MPAKDEAVTFSRVLGVALLSGAALAFEILLLRIFSIADWHHLAFLVLSLALFGYGASGTFLAVAAERVTRRPATVASVAAISFAAAAPLSVIVYQNLEFNSLEIIWSGRQAALLFVLYVLFAIPLFAAATGIGLMLSRHAADASRLYRADLIGAGLSAVIVTALLYFVHPVTALQVAAGCGAVAAALFALSTPAARPLCAAAAVIAILVALARPLLAPLQTSPFKELSQALRIPGARVIATRYSPLGVVTAVENRAVPFRFAPGLSLNYPGSLPEQVALFTDAGGMSVVGRFDGKSVDHFRHLPMAAAYHLGRNPETVAVIGAGGGAEILSALTHGSRRVIAVEVNRAVTDVVREDLEDFSGGIFDDPRVAVKAVDGRRFITETEERFDVIQLSLVDSLASSASGTHGVAENFLYTVEAFSSWLDRLKPDGLLSMTRWMQVPPRDIVKLLATAAVALEKRGAEPSEHLAVVRTWNTVTMLVKRSAWNASELAALRRFCDERSFDLDFAPGLVRSDTNRYNLLDDSFVFDAASAIVSDARQDFFRRYKFDVRPATDERPFFSHFFKWSVLPELLRLRSRGAMPLMEWGYLMVVAALMQAIIASLLLIIFPLLIRRRRAPAIRRTTTLTLVASFAALGLAFLFIEMAFIQRLTLFLGHPSFAIALVLATFLVFAGIGSGFSRRFHRIRYIAVLVGAFAITALFVLRVLPTFALALPLPVKIGISLLLLAPLAFLMGMPFPMALKALAGNDPGALPWAWGINGAASALSSICATLLAIHGGFSAVMVVAAILYLIAGHFLDRLQRGGSETASGDVLRL